jgi:hypothetical protein
MFEIGSRPLICGEATTLRGHLITAEPWNGSSKGRLSRNGTRRVQVLFYGFMGNVGIPRSNLFDITNEIPFSQQVQGRPFFGT